MVRSAPRVHAAVRRDDGGAHLLLCGYDRAEHLRAGSTFYVQSFNVSCRNQGLVNRKYYYAKFVIDSINYTPYNAVSNPKGRTIYYRMVTDPNCGFTSLEPGIPPS